MKASVTNIDKFIKDNGWMEVKVANYFVPNTTHPHPDGLFSEDIFGMPGTTARKFRWGYISLNDTFMHPHCYYVFLRLKNKIAEDMKHGLGQYYVDSKGELTPLELGETVPETALFKEVGTGFKWLKKAWPFITWKINKSMTGTAKNRRLFLQNRTSSEAFVDKWIVIPAYYRDVDLTSNTRNSINSMFYTKILYYASMIRSTDEMGIAFDDPTIPKSSVAHVKMQDLLYEMYEFFIRKCGGANSFIHTFVSGKNTDYGARLVISSPDMNVEHYTQLEADFFHSSTPLAIAINIFAPYMIFGTVKFIKDFVQGKRFIQVWNPTKQKLEDKELDPAYMDEFTVENIKKMLDRYKKSKWDRVQPVTLKGVNGERIPMRIYKHRNKAVAEENEIYTDVSKFEEKQGFDKEVQQNVLFKDLTYCEMFYVIAEDNLKGKHVYNTRYPMLWYLATYPSEMNIIPCKKYTSMVMNGKIYPRYPIINPKTEEDIEHMFVDTMRMFSVYTKGLNADFDGDQISTQSVFCKESNEDCKNYTHSVSNIVGIDGNIVREIPAVAVHGIYGLTYRLNKPEEKK